MYCNRCGNNLSPESQYCNRCGNRVHAESRSRRPHSIPPPRVRPARRRLVAEEQYTESPYAEDEYEYEYEQPDDFAEVPKPETDEEETIFTIYPAFYGIAAQYVIAILLSIAVTAAIAYYNLPLWIALAVAAICFIRPFYNHIHHNHTVYKLTTVKVEIRSGLFSKTSRNIPLRHIQDVTVSESFRERLIGIGDVVIDSAAVEGKIVMPNIKDPRKYAEMILNQLQYWN